MKSNVLVSLCIPTDGKVNLVIPTIESIYSQGVDFSLFEVIVTDNGKSDALEKIIGRFDYPNFHYYRTSSEGFTNQIDAIEKSSGYFCKLVSHRCRMLPGSLKDLICIVKDYEETKPIIYCTDGNIKSDEICKCNDIDEFVSRMSYFISWGGGTCAWREDLVNIRKKTIDVLFPHTVYLFDLRKNSEYLIWNKKITTMEDDRKKGGYNFYQAFSVHLLDIVHGLRMDNRVRPETFIKFKSNLFLFLSDTYIIEKIIPSKHKYDLRDIKKSMSVHYGVFYYYYMIFLAYVNFPYKVVRKLLFGKSALAR